MPEDADGLASPAGAPAGAPSRWSLPAPRISTPGTFTPGAFAVMPEGVDGWTELRHWDLPEYVDIRNLPGWHTGLQRGFYY